MNETYCEKCLTTPPSDDAFDYRFDYPVCSTCVSKLGLKPETYCGDCLTPISQCSHAKAGAR